MSSLRMRSRRPATSRDVAVLSCIPLDATEWDQRFSSRPCGDFVRFIAETRFAGDAKLAWDFFSAEAAFVQKKLASFERSGIAVTRRATCEHVRDAAARYGNVVVIAHWKGDTVL